MNKQSNHTNRTISDESASKKCPFSAQQHSDQSTNTINESPAETSISASAECPMSTGSVIETLSGKAAAYKISRRGMIIGSGALAAMGVALGLGSYKAGDAYGIAKGHVEADIILQKHNFRGEHQPGIITAQQQQLHFAAYDLTTSRKEAVIQLLKDWSLAAERMMAGNLIGEYKAFKDVPPDDTGETGDLGPAALTITIGFGATFFRDASGKDRFGVAKYMPKALADGIPRMSAENLDLQKCHGDLVVQACAEDPMVAMHAIHNMTRIAFGTASLRWSQLGYGRTSATSNKQKTPRNLFGFKDGTSNLKAEDPQSELNKHLWIQPEDEGGTKIAGGTYICVRKIKQFMEVWDELVLSEQEATIGREKITGAPLSGGTEHTAPDFKKVGPDGQIIIPEDSHIAVVHPDNNGGSRMLRRGYNYMEGNDKLGRLEGGLFFIAYVRNPQTNFVPILAKMRSDALTEYLQHLATGVYLIPPGMRAGDTYVGQSFLE